MKIRRLFVWICWEFSGARLISEKIMPPKENAANKRPPSSFFLWFLGIYVALFGIAAQRFESKLNIFETRTNIIISQLSTPSYKNALDIVPSLQRMDLPTQPDILNPISVFKSFFIKGEKYNNGIYNLKQVVSTWRSSLNDVNFVNVDLEGINLEGANFRNAQLSGADLERSKLFKANLENARIYGANFSDADLAMANMKGTYFMAKDELGNIMVPDFKNASLLYADLRDAHIYDIKILSTCKTLYGAKLDKSIESSIGKKYPRLLDRPEENGYLKFIEEQIASFKQ